MRDDAIRRLSASELVGRLIDNMSLLIDREVLLAKEEARSDATRVGAGAGLLLLAGLMLYTFVAALIVAAILAIYWAIWGSIFSVYAALIIAGIFLFLALVLGGVGVLIANIRPLQRTRETVREDIEWARNRMT